MSYNYIGQPPVFGDFPFQTLVGDGGVQYSLNYTVSNENGILVFLGGAIQRPGLDYTAGGSTLIFSSPVASGVQIFTYGMGLPKSSLAPSDGASLATPTQFDVSDKIATTRFVQNALGNYQSITKFPNGSTLPVSAAGSHCCPTGATGTTTVYLPLLNSVPYGASYFVHNTTPYPVIVSCSGSDTLSPNGNIRTTYVVPKGTGVTITKVYTEIWIVSGTGALSDSAEFAFSASVTGYQKVTGGFLLQWGDTASIASGSSAQVTLPMSTPTFTKVLSLVPLAASNGTTPVSGGVSGVSGTGFTVRNLSTVASSFSWYAIGYP